MSTRDAGVVPTASRRFLVATPLLNAVALYAVVSGAWISAALATLAVMVAVVVGPRVRATPSGQWLAAVILTVAVFAVGNAVVSDDERLVGLGAVWSGIALAAILQASLRLALEDAHGGPKITYALGLVALLACGETRSGLVYAVAVFAYLLTTAWALRALDDERPAWTALSRRSRALSIALPLGAGLVAWAASAPLPPLQQWLQGKFEDAYFNQRVRVGFSDRLRLGSMAGMLTSDEVVLRLYGPRADYLRGVVYNRYDHGRWTFGDRSPASESAAWAPRDLIRNGALGVVEARRVAGSPDRLFLPLETRAIATASSTVRYDTMGIAFRAANDAGRSTFIALGPRARAAEPGSIALPRADDLAVPPELEPRLAALAASWTGNAIDPSTKLARIAKALEASYRYSLSFTRANPDDEDALLDFLFTHREGHCEYFASALALLARTQGVPARVVAGYRVVEHNRLGDYHVVRENNAHAWVEAWLPDHGWTTVDATPASAQPQNGDRDASMLSALADALSASWGDAKAWLVARSARELWTGALVATLLLLVVQGIRGRGASSVHVTLPDTEAPFAPPLPMVIALLRALERHGLTRGDDESVERFAARVGESHPTCGVVVARYAALRYGGEGDAQALARDLDAATATLASAPRTASPAEGRRAGTASTRSPGP